MAATKDLDKMRTRQKILAFDFDPGVDTPVDVSWQDFRDFESIVIGFVRTIGTGNLDTFRLLGNAQSDGGGTDVVIRTKTISSEPDAVGDTVWLESDAAEIVTAGAAAGERLRYVTANVEFAAGGDEGVVIYVMNAKYPGSTLTTDVIA